MQSPRITPPQAPPVTPTPPTAPTAVIPGGGANPGQIEIPVPLTAREISAIRARRSELSNQLTSAEGRRENLVQQLEDATGANRAGIEQRIQLLDKRILQLETDIAVTGQQLTSAPAGDAFIAARGPGGRNFDFNSENVAIVSGLVTIFVFFPLAVGAARLMWRRARLPVAPPGWADASQRLERMEQAMDTIAIEMERVSEGQRFTTKLLTQRVSALDGSGAAEDPGIKALGAGAAEPNEINQKQAARVPSN